MRRRGAIAAAVLWLLTACTGASITTATATSATATPQGSAATSAAPRRSAAASPATAAPRPPCPGGPRCDRIAASLGSIAPSRLNEHLAALTAPGSRDPRHPGHATAVAYIKERLGALSSAGWVITSQRVVSDGIPLENIFATLTPEGPTALGEGILLSAHYDSSATRTPGWRPALDPAPGANDNATGTAGLLEIARVLSEQRQVPLDRLDRPDDPLLRRPITLAFFDGEELFFKGSAAYLASLAKPYPFVAAINLDMVGFNPLADRLDLLWYTGASAGLRDRAIRANQTYAIGVSPLNAQFAADGSTIMDAAPFGLAGIPSIALCERYGGPDATYPGNGAFHTVADTPEKVTNPGLWLKATKLTLAIALELATD